MDDLVERALEQAGDNQQEANTAREFGPPRILVIGCGEKALASVDHIQQQCDEVETLALSNIGSKNADFTYTFTKSSSTSWTDAENIEAFLPDDAPLDELADILQRADLCLVLADVMEAEVLPAVATAIKATEHSPPMSVGLFTLQRAAEETQSAETPGAWFHEALGRLTSIGVIDATTVAKERGIGISDARARSRAMHAQMVVELTNTLIQPSLINLDYAGLRTVLSEKEGVFTLQVTQISEERMSHLSAELDSIVLRPLYPTELTDVSSCWTHITTGPGITLNTAERIADNISRTLEEKRGSDPINSNVWGARVINSPGIRLQIVYAGIKMSETLQLVIER